LGRAISIVEELIVHPEQKGNINQVSTALHREGYRDLDKQAKSIVAYW